MRRMQRKVSVRRDVLKVELRGEESSKGTPSSPWTLVIQSKFLKMTLCLTTHRKSHNVWARNTRITFPGFCVMFLG